MDDEEAHPSVACSLMYGSAMRLEAGSLGTGREVRAVQAVHAAVITLQQFTNNSLGSDSLVLREQRPALAKTMLDPLVISDIFRVIREMITNEMNDPAPLDEQRRGSPTETPVRKELRRRL
jgi:hypothetical protein